MAYEHGCYKVIVDIPEKDKNIYMEKGYKVKGAGMQMYQKEYKGRYHKMWAYKRQTYFF